MEDVTLASADSKGDDVRCLGQLVRCEHGAHGYLASLSDMREYVLIRVVRLGTLNIFGTAHVAFYIFLA